MKTTCVIPAYNESKNLLAVIEKLKTKVDEIVVVDDCSTDDTLEILNGLPIKVLSHPLNRGQGAALKTGTIYALDNGADVIVHFDADGQFRAEDIDRLTAVIKQGEADIVFGSRFLDNTTKMPWFKKYLLMVLARWFNRWFLKIKLTDPQSGLRSFNRRAGELLDWEQDRMAHCSEILVAAHRADLKIAEVPITVLYKDFGQRLSGGFKILQDFFIHKLNK